MKTYLYFLLFFTYSTGYGQVLNLLGFDNDGNIIDEISFGKIGNATTGLDELLGEVDYSENMNKTGIYIVQRDSINHNCLIDYYTSDIIYFDTELISKQNYRPFENVKELFFEIIVVNPDSFGIFQMNIDEGTLLLNEFVDYNQLHYEQCDRDAVPFLVGDFDFQLNELVFTSEELFTDSSYLKHIVVKFKDNLVVSNTEINIIDNNFLTYPNPTTDVLNITSNELNNSHTQIKIFNLLGKEVLQSEYTNTIDVQYLESGSYFLHIFEKDDLKSVTKFIKI